MPTHKIIIKKILVKPNLPKELNEGNKKIGSYMTKSGAVGQPPRDLMLQYMPEILNMSADSIDFALACKKYFVDLDIYIDDDGKEMEVGLDSMGFPINIIDYMHFIYLKEHPLVASSKTEAVNSMRHVWYYQDNALIEEQYQQNMTEEREALKLLYTYESDTNTLKYILILLEQPVALAKTSNDYMNIAEKYIRKNKEQRDKFLAIKNKTDIKIRAFAQVLYKQELVQRVGDIFYYRNLKIGNEDAFVLWFKDPENRDQVVELQARVKEQEKLRTLAV